MIFVLNKLSVRKILEATKPAYLLDGGGLYLQIGRRTPAREGDPERKPTEEVWKSWCFRYHDRITGRRREMGLGPLFDVSLAEAREKATALRKMLLDGKAPPRRAQPQAGRSQGRGRRHHPP